MRTGGDKDAKTSLETRNRWDKLNQSISDRHGSLELKNKPMLRTLQSSRDKKGQYDRTDDHFYTRLNLLPVI